MIGMEWQKGGSWFQRHGDEEFVIDNKEDVDGLAGDKRWVVSSASELNRDES